MTIANYEQVLRDNFVLVRARRTQAAHRGRLGPDVQPDDELLDTLVYLTEFPTAIRGSFDPSFLELPKEILSTVMRHHQRYFSVLNEDGSLAPDFVAVTNTDGDPDGLIRKAMSEFCAPASTTRGSSGDVDQQKTLADRVADLAKVTFQAKLGSYKDKTERVVDSAGNWPITSAQTMTR